MNFLLHCPSQQVLGNDWTAACIPPWEIKKKRVRLALLFSGWHMDQSTNSFLRTGFLVALTPEVEDVREMNLGSLSTSQIKLAQIPDPRTLQRCLIQMRLIKFKEGEGSSCKSPFPWGNTRDSEKKKICTNIFGGGEHLAHPHGR